MSSVVRWEDKGAKGPIVYKIASVATTAGRQDLADEIIRSAEERLVSPIASAIQQLRARLNYTQSELAESAGVATSTVARSETSALPDAAVLKKFMLFRPKA